MGEKVVDLAAEREKRSLSCMSGLVTAYRGEASIVVHMEKEEYDATQGQGEGLSVYEEAS